MLRFLRHQGAKRLKLLSAGRRQFASKLLAKRIKENQGSLFEAKYSISKDRTSQHCVHGEKDYFTAQLSLINQKNHNFLTNKMIRELIQNFEWMDFDVWVRFVRINTDSTDGIFSFGTDSKCIAKYVQNGQFNEAAAYVGNLQNLAITLSRYNKPHLIELEGTLSNSAISIFSQMCMASADQSTKFVFNEAERGTIFLGGNSFLLSRLPEGLGEFVALTGATMDYHDIYKYKLVNKRAKLTENEFIRMEQFHQVSTSHSEITLLSTTKFLKDYLSESYREQLFHTEIEEELTNRIEISKENPMTVLRDLVYKLEVTKMSNNFDRSQAVKKTEAQIRDFMSNELVSLIENRMTTFEYALLNRYEKEQAFIYEGDSNVGGAIYLEEENARFFFSRGTFQEVMSKLEAHKDAPFAKRVLSRIQYFKDTGKLQLVKNLFKQVRKARQLDYVGSLVMEYKTAVKFFKIKDKLNAFEPSSPINAVLPIRNYYKFLPDALRYELNTHHCNDIYINKNYGKTRKYYLQILGFDIWNPNVTNETIRRELWNRDFKVFNQDTKRRNLFHTLTNIQKRREFLGEREEAISKLFGATNLEARLEDCIRRSFNREFYRNMDLVDQKSKTLSKIIKKREFARLRSSIIKEKFQVNQDTFDSFDNTEMRVVGTIDETINLRIENKDPLAIDFYHLDKTMATQDVIVVDKMIPEIAESYINGTLRLEHLVSITAKDNTSDTTIQRKIETEKGKRELTYYEYIRTMDYVERNIKSRGIWGTPHELQAEFIDLVLTRLQQSFSGISPKVKETVTAEMDRLHLGRMTDNNKFIWAIEEDHFEDVNIDNLNIVNLNSMDGKRKYVSNEQVSDLMDSIAPIIDLEMDKTDTLKNKTTSSLAAHKRVLAELIKTQLQYDLFLKQRLNIIFEDVSNIPSEGQREFEVITPLLKKMKASLVSIFNSKLQDIKKDTGETNSNVLPFIQGIYDIDSESNFMGQIDNYLNKNIDLEFFNYLSSHIMFRFAFKQLKIFENVFTTLKENLQMSISKSDVQSSLSEILQIEIQSEEELEIVVEFLDRMSFDLAEIIDHYEEKLHFSEDLRFKQSEEAIRKYLETMTNAKPSQQFTEFFRRFSSETKKVEIQESGNNLDVIENEFDAVKLSLDGTNLSNSKEEIVRKHIQQLQQAGATIRGVKGYLPSLQGSIIKLEGYYKAVVEGADSGVHQLDEDIFEDVFDDLVGVQMSGEEWIQSTIEDYVENILLIRKKSEPYLSQAELVGYDSIIAKYLEPENIKIVIRDEFENLKFRMSLVQDMVARKNEIRAFNFHNTKKGMNLSYFIRNRVKNSIAFKHLISLNAVIDYKYLLSKAFHYPLFLKFQPDRKTLHKKEYTEQDKLLDEIAVERLIRESQLNPGEELQEFVGIQKLGQSIYNAKQTDGVQTFSESYIDSNIQRYCNLMLRGINANDYQSTNDDVRSNINDLVKRLDLYGLNQFPKNVHILNF